LRKQYARKEEVTSVHLDQYKISGHRKNGPGKKKGLFSSFEGVNHNGATSPDKEEKKGKTANWNRGELSSL